MTHNSRLREILTSFQNGSITLADAEEAVEGLRIEHLHGIARLDVDRGVRCGVPEVVLAEGKNSRHLVRIIERQVTAAGRCIVTRITPAQVQEVTSGLGDAPAGGRVGVLSGGTADIRVAEEAAVIAEEMGCRVYRAYDVGVAGIHRLFPALVEMRDAHVLVVAAGREGTLPAVVAGLVDRPVVGLPVSVGYGFMGKGEAALASMLQACTVLAVVNIDAGFVAGAYAARIANMVAER